MENKQDDLSTKYTSDPLCPYCGHIVINAWEIYFEDMEGDAELECSGCGQKFICSREVTVTYSTSKINEDNRHRR